jgi:hypothetical protein
LAVANERCVGILLIHLCLTWCLLRALRDGSLHVRLTRIQESVPEALTGLIRSDTCCGIC